MAATPEGKVKIAVDTELLSYGLIPAAKAAGRQSGTGWFFKPATHGYGVSGVPDYIGHYKGHLFGIETKVPGKDPTALQQVQLDALTLTGATTFVIRGEDDLPPLRRWFQHIDSKLFVGLDF